MAPESWPPWPGSSTTRVNGERALVRPVEVTNRGVERTCHQINDASISNNPSQATMFFVFTPKPIRFPNIVSCEWFRALRHQTEFDSESRSCGRAPARQLRFPHCRVAHLDVGESRHAPEVP